MAYLIHYAVSWALPLRYVGVFVAIWHEDRILLIRNSYRRELTLPGGLMRRGESVLAAGLRETREEVGITLAPEAVEQVPVPPGVRLRRGETVHFLVARLSAAPVIQVDQREVVAATWTRADEALALPLLPAVRCYLAARLVAGDS